MRGWERVAVAVADPDVLTLERITGRSGRWVNTA